MLRYAPLIKNGAPFWVEADGKQGSEHLTPVLAELVCVAWNGEGVQVDDREEELVRLAGVVLHVLPLLQRAEIVP